MERFLSLFQIFSMILSSLLHEEESQIEQEVFQIIQKTKQLNPWFTKKQLEFCFKHWVQCLTSENLLNWMESYPIYSPKNPKKIGLILAGNIPLAGFHDVLCVVLSGHIPIIKLSSKDSQLIPWILKKWQQNFTKLNYEIVKTLNDYNAVIATGSESSSIYFEYYFKNIPHIIRKNRTSISVLTKKESAKDLQLLGRDIFTYFGLGCRSVTQIFVPEDFKIHFLYENFIQYKEIIMHNTYANNYDYHRAIFLLNQDQFWDNGFLLIKKSDQLFSPISVLFISSYKNIIEIENFIQFKKEKIQTVVSSLKLKTIKSIPFGTSQTPTLQCYSDGIDTMEFLINI